MVSHTPSLSIVGCGNVGRTLGRLFHQSGVFAVQDILTSSLDGAVDAVSFVGAGVPCNTVAEMRQVDVVLIATPDSVVSDIGRELLSSKVPGAGAVVFHCSGALSSGVLADLQGLGVAVASVHPVKSFSSPSDAVSSFSGTHCAIEGDEDAVARLSSAFERIGAKLFAIKTEAKMLYHVSLVFACNYLTALMECAFQCCEGAGITRTEAARMIEPLVKETTAAVMSRGVESALTGPVARGDAEVVAQQLGTLGGWRSDYAELYARLGQVALEVAERGGAISDVEVQRTREALRGG